MDIYEKIEFVLSQKDDYLIKRGVEYDWDKIRDLYLKYSTTKFDAIVEKFGDDKLKFIGTRNCSQCGNRAKFEYSKQKFISCLAKKDVICKECEKKNAAANKLTKQQILEIERNSAEEKRLRDLERLNSFIDDFLNTENKWNKLGRDSFDMIYRHSFGIHEQIASYIKSMGYREFLKTPYWAAVAWEVKRKAGFKCVFCNLSKNLNAHHRTYENHGMEVYHLKDLTCICSECHNKHHNK